MNPLVSSIEESFSRSKTELQVYTPRERPTFLTTSPFAPASLVPASKPRPGAVYPSIRYIARRVQNTADYRVFVVRTTTQFHSTDATLGKSINTEEKAIGIGGKVVSLTFKSAVRYLHTMRNKLVSSGNVELTLEEPERPFLFAHFVKPSPHRPQLAAPEIAANRTLTA